MKLFDKNCQKENVFVEEYDESFSLSLDALTIIKYRWMREYPDLA